MLSVTTCRCRNLAIIRYYLYPKWATRNKIVPSTYYIAIEFFMKELRRPSNSLMRISKTLSRVSLFFSRLTTAKCAPLNNTIKLHPKYLISTILVPIIRPWFISSALHKTREIYRFQKVRIHLLGDLIIQIMRVPTPIT